jgi:hypothetical protein
MRLSRLATTAASAALVTAGLAGVTGSADAASRWAPAGTAKIYPGIQTNTAGGGQCTANFVFTDSAANVYLGQSAHCGGLGEATDTNGCDSGSVPLGTKVTFNKGGSVLSAGTQVGAGKLAYSSWITMKKRGEKNANACAYNDFALIKVNAADVGKVNPTIPIWGGPVGINTTGTKAGDQVYSYGNSGLRGGIEALSPKTGISLGDAAADGGWSHPLYTLTPGIPGDSGSAFLDAGGKAVGTLSTLGLAPLPASNNIGDLNKELNYAKSYSGIAGLRLVNGTEPFTGLGLG